MSDELPSGIPDVSFDMFELARPRDADDFPIGTVVRTPLGELARVEAYRGGRRMGGGYKDLHERLVCRYLQPKNRAFAVVTLRAELVTVVPADEVPKPQTRAAAHEVA